MRGEGEGGPLMAQTNVWDLIKEETPAMKPAA